MYISITIKAIQLVKHEKMLFSRQFFDVLNPFIGCQQFEEKI